MTGPMRDPGPDDENADYGAGIPWWVAAALLTLAVGAIAEALA